MRLRKEALDNFVCPRIIRDPESLLITQCRFLLRCLLLILLEVHYFRIWLRELLHGSVILGECLSAKGLQILPIFQKCGGILPLNLLNLLTGVMNIVVQLANPRVVCLIM